MAGGKHSHLLVVAQVPSLVSINESEIPSHATSSQLCDRVAGRAYLDVDLQAESTQLTHLRQAVRLTGQPPRE